MIDNLTGCPYVVIDTETTGLDWHRDRVFGIAIETPDGQQRYLDIRNEDELRWAQGELPKVGRYINHHIKFDIHMLRESGVPIASDRCHCTMISAALINEHEFSYGLDPLAKQYVGFGKDETIWETLAALFGGAATRKTQIGNLPRAPRELVERYALQDVRAAHALYKWQWEQVMGQHLERVHALEHDLLPVIVELERHGVAVDRRRAEDTAVRLEEDMVVVQRELNSATGMTVNVNSNPQMIKMFVGDQIDDAHWRSRCGTVILNATPSGKSPSVGADELRKMHDPLAARVLKLRQMRRTVDTFLRGHILGHMAPDGRIHANYNQTRSDNGKGTETGRFSVNDPALQQIHKRNKEIAPMVRSCFIPDDGQDWASYDWSQMDFRVFAHYVNSPEVMQVYANDPDADFHAVVSALTGIPRDKQPGIKGNAKQINLGLIFGMQPGRMAQEMDLPYTEESFKANTRDGTIVRRWLKPGPEAEALFARYHEAIPGVRGLLDDASALAKRRGWVKTIMGRRIRFPGGQFTHKAAGLVFQGSAADALKVKLVEVFRLLQGTDSKLILNVHDEFDISLERGDRGERLKGDIRTCIEKFDGVDTPIKFRTPIRCSLGVGPDWWEASK